MRRVTVVLEGGEVGAKLALAIAIQQKLAPVNFSQRRDGNVACVALATLEDKSARARWVKACKQVGLIVVPAPWETKK